VQPRVVFAPRRLPAGNFGRPEASATTMKLPAIFGKQPIDERRSGIAEARQHAAQPLEILTIERGAARAAAHRIEARVLARGKDRGGKDRALGVGDTKRFVFQKDNVAALEERG